MPTIMLPIYIASASVLTIEILQSDLPVAMKTTLVVINYLLVAVGAVALFSEKHPLKVGMWATFLVGTPVFCIICGINKINLLFAVPADDCSYYRCDNSCC